MACPASVGRLLWLATVAHLCMGVSHWRLDGHGAIVPVPPAPSPAGDVADSSTAPATGHPSLGGPTGGGTVGASAAWRLGLEDAVADGGLHAAFMRLQQRQQGVRRVVLLPPQQQLLLAQQRLAADGSSGSSRSSGSAQQVGLATVVTVAFMSFGWGHGWRQGPGVCLAMAQTCMVQTHAYYST